MIKKELSLRMGENVRQCRKDKGYTQEDLAEACNFTLLERGIRKC